MRRHDDDEAVGPGDPEWLTWLKGVLTERGYDVKNTRGGGKARLAKDTGLAASTITRIMQGQVPDFDAQLTLARLLDLRIDDFLIRTGKATEDDFPHRGSDSGHVGVSSGKPLTQLTPEELALQAGVPKGDADWFATMVRRLRKRGDTDDSAAGGAAAEG